MTKPFSRPDRRGADRPAAGNWKPCALCAEGMLVFSEEFRSVPPSSSATPRRPAWVCDHCPNVVFVRAEHQPAAVRGRAKTLRARARQRLMKARFVRGRADRALQKSLRKKRR